jgi:hypothetical protein
MLMQPVVVAPCHARSLHQRQDCHVHASAKHVLHTILMMILLDAHIKIADNHLKSVKSTNTV